MSMNWNDPQIVPHDINAERSLIGSAIIDPDVLLDYQDLTKFHFYNSALGEIWATMQEMVASGQAVDLVTLTPQIKAKDGRVDMDKLINLVTETPNSIHAADYVRIVKQYAKRRQAIRIANKIANAGYSGSGIDADIVEELGKVAGGEESPAPSWSIKTVGDVYKERKPTRYLIDGILPKPSLNVWFGAPGSKKSLLLADMAICCVAGSDWLPGGNETYYTEKSRVLWIDTDNGNDVTHERFAALAKARQLPTDAPFYYISMPDPWFFASDPASQIDLHNTVRDLKIDLVIIDNLGNITGDIEENSAQMVRVMSPLRRLADEMSVAVIVIHHQRKGGANGGRSGDALRGHSVIEASLDFAVLVSGEEGEELTSIKCTKARRFRFDDIRAQFNFDHKPGTRDLDIAWWTIPTPKRGQNPIRDGIVDVLKANEKMTQERLLDAVYDYLSHKYSRTKIRGWIKEMSDITNELKIEKGQYNANIYSLKE